MKSNSQYRFDVTGRTPQSSVYSSKSNIGQHFSQADFGIPVRSSSPPISQKPSHSNNLNCNISNNSGNNNNNINTNESKNCDHLTPDSDPSTSFNEIAMVEDNSCNNNSNNCNSTINIVQDNDNANNINIGAVAVPSRSVSRAVSTSTIPSDHEDNRNKDSTSTNKNNNNYTNKYNSTSTSKNGTNKKKHVIGKLVKSQSRSRSQFSIYNRNNNNNNNNVKRRMRGSQNYISWWIAFFSATFYVFRQLFDSGMQITWNKMYVFCPRDIPFIMYSGKHFCND